MYTRTYNLDSRKYIQNMDLIKNALLDLSGVSEVKVLAETSSLIVDFDNPLSEKQVLCTINQYKRKH